MLDQNHFFLLGSLASAAPLPADRGGLLAGALRPFAGRPNVFVADEHVATKVTIHKTSTLDIEVVISTATRQWSATVRDAATGRSLVHDTAHYHAGEATTAIEQRAAMLGDLRTFLGAVVDAPVRLAVSTQPSLEIEAGNGWQQAVPFPR